MELVLVNSVNTLVELDMGASMESLGDFLDSQRELFHCQIDQLQKIVVTQCKLTGVNPLSQEMAAGALSIKIGKRPRDLLNPKAIKYMQSLFSIKDTFGKKETREISALCGVTITQVREFFAGQRSRIRKLVRLSREKAIRSEACKPSNNECSTSSDPAILDSKQDRISSVSIKTVEESRQVPVNSEHPSTVQEDKQALVNSGHDVTVQENKQAPVDLVVPKTGEEVPSSSLQEETIPGVDPDDKKIVENVYSLMRKEETFSGQVKLMEWILQIDNSALLHWFLTKGGLMILATWLSQAAVEEQTTVLLVILKVLCHLPLHKALPVQMSAILQTVNKLRFYRTSDISNRARVLLSRWSRLFVRSQGLKRPTSANSSTDAQKQIIRRQRISEILSDESWQSKLDIPEEILALDNEGSECSRIMEPKRTLELLPSSCVESNKKHVRDIMSLKTKQRRKVLLVEQPDRKTTSRNVFISRPVLANHSRPISADDIQKAKMRAVFMQNKYGKIDASANGNPSEKINDQTISSAFQTTSILPVARLSKVKINEDKKPVAPATETSNRPNTARETLVNSKTNSTSQEPLWEKLKSIHIPWQTPPEMVTNCLWRVGAGENSKEVEVQTQRTRRERESVYQNVDDIPSNPKDPWDIEMDFDDSLTVEIPTEQSPDAPDADSTEDSGDGGGGDAASLISPENNSDNAVDLPVATSAPSNPITATDAIPEPDLELLAVLLKNPDLVFALTSGQGNNLTSSETVALLDMLKKSDVGLAGMLNGFAGNATEKSEPMSLPSPTPPSDTTIGYRLESRPFAKNPPLQPHLRDKDFAASPAAPPILPPLPILSSATTILSMPHVTVTINPSSQHKPVTYLPSNKAPPLPHQVPATISPLQRFTNHATMQAVKNFPSSSMPSASSSPWRETLDFDQPPKLNPIPSIQPTLPTTARPHPPLLSEGPPFPRLAPPRWPPGAANVRRDPMPDSWNGRTDGLLGVRSLNSRLPANQHNYSSSAGPVRALPVLIGRAAEETEILDESDRENWSPERSPSLFGEFRSTRNFPESRRDHGRNNRPEWHRPHNSGQRDRHNRSSRRWRDRDRDRGRDWRR